MPKKLVASTQIEVCQIAIFDDIHENVQRHINELFRELQITNKEISSERYEQYLSKNKDGNEIKCTYAVIRYELKNPAK